MGRRRLATAALAVGLLFIYAYIWASGQGQRNEQRGLEAQVADVSQTLSQIAMPARDLEKRLVEAEADLRAEGSALPERANTTEVIGVILGHARESGVGVTFISTETWASEDVGGAEYLVLSLSLEVEGSLGQLRTFMDRIESGAAGTIRLRGAAVSAVEGESARESGVEHTSVSASLDVAVFARQAAGNPGDDTADDVPPEETTE